MDVTKLDKEKGRDVPKFTQSEQRRTSDLTADTSKRIFTTRVFPYGFSAYEYPSRLLQETTPRITIPLRQRRLETWWVCLFFFFEGMMGDGWCKEGEGLLQKISSGGWYLWQKAFRRYLLNLFFASTVQLYVHFSLIHQLTHIIIWQWVVSICDTPTYNLLTTHIFSTTPPPRSS